MIQYANEVINLVHQSCWLLEASSVNEGLGDTINTISFVVIARPSSRLAAPQSSLAIRQT